MGCRGLVSAGLGFNLKRDITGEDIMVSVIMPAYNAQKYIGSAIDSILEQTYTDLELLIIEDCSTDDTLKVIESYKDDRIRVFKNTANMGIAHSTNVGLRESKGDYIALLDDDDMAARDRLGIQVKYLEDHPGIDILGGRSVTMDENNHYLKIGNEPRRNPKYVKASLLFQRVDFMNGTTMIRSDFLKEHRLCYQDGCFGMQDYKFFVDASKVGNISAVENILLFSRVYDMCETAKEKRERKTERAQKYFEIQRDSLRTSGYCLNDQEMRVIRDLFPEEGAVCRDYGEYHALIYVFDRLLKQAEEMKIDYLDELEHVCKTAVARQAVKMKHFTMEMFLGNRKV